MFTFFGQWYVYFRREYIHEMNIIRKCKSRVKERFFKGVYEICSFLNDRSIQPLTFRLIYFMGIFFFYISTYILPLSNVFVSTAFVKYNSPL